MTAKTIKFKLPFLKISERDYAGLSFGGRIEYDRQIVEWRAEAKSLWLSQKRKNYKAAIKEAIALTNCKEYYCSMYCDPNYYDDSFQFFYK
jgi:hypothetical protein